MVSLMSNTTKDVAQDSTQTPAEKTDNNPEVKPQETISEQLKTTNNKVDNVPLATYLSAKNEAKEMSAKIKELEAKVAEGATKVEISDDIEALGREYSVDPKFLARLTATMTAKAKSEMARETEEVLGPLKEKDRQEQIDKAFKTSFGVAMETLPELKAVVNADIIKQLSLLPQNANKTFVQLIEETYGNAVTGRRTIETSTPNGGREPASIDYNRASKDNAYLNEILSNPQTKAEYNRDLHKRIKF